MPQTSRRHIEEHSDNPLKRTLKNDNGVDEICRSLGISKPTLYAYVQAVKG